ncbi:MAG: 50S ribosomal protein L6 [Patescibacteria group bacterium]|nr:MAG: 50S ribosomal protein L6 [Patescibacteria group bacterium]
MSKIGFAPIKLSTVVEVEIEENKVVVKGPKGTVDILLPDKIEVSYDKENRVLQVVRKSDQKKVKAQHGLIRKLIYNAVVGVEKEWEKRLEVIGTGYNVSLNGQDLVFKLGFSHPVVFNKVDGVNFAVEKNRVVIVKGIDKQKVGEVASKIAHLKKPDAYKGKGIRYEGQVVKLKPGKKAKVA